MQSQITDTGVRKEETNKRTAYDSAIRHRLIAGLCRVKNILSKKLSVFRALKATDQCTADADFLLQP